MGGTVLVVDDDESVRSLAARVLRREGHTVVEAADGAEALEEARSALAAGGDGLGLLLTDVVLPGMNGAQLAEMLRLDAPGLPVVFMSGFEEAELEARGIREIGASYVTKPFTPYVLSLVVRGVLAE